MSVDLDIDEIDFATLPLELRAEFERRFRKKDQLTEAQGFLADLHPHQLAFIQDKSRRKAALCSRRAGKSFLILAWLIEGGLLDPGGQSVYVARSKGDARRILGPAIHHYQSRWPQLGLRLREQDGQLKLVVDASGHEIWLAGAKDQHAIDKFRGSKYRRVAIDEAQEYGQFLRELVIDVIEPALIDKAGDLALCGTPGPVPAGMFYEVTTGDSGSPKWPTHHWTLLDNPHLVDAQRELDDFCREYGLTKDSATYRREYAGEWVRDIGAQVYPYSYELNAITKGDVPGGLSHVLSVDIGFTDATAFVVAGVSNVSPNIFILESRKRTEMTPSDVAASVTKYIGTYGRGLRVVVDEGGIGKGYAAEMRSRYGIGCVPAEKTKKRAFQEIVAGELKAGTIKIVASECGDLLDEMAVLQWGAGHVAEDGRFENHCCDALLYSVRASRSWYRPPVPGPVIGSPEWHDAERKRQRDMIMERVRKRNKGRGWRRS